MKAELRVVVRALTYEQDLAAGALLVGSIFAAHRDGISYRELIFPCGPSVPPASFQVEPGRYVVSATLPSGSVLSEDVEVTGLGPPPLVELDASDSPYESHAWQYVLGNVESAPQYHGGKPLPVPRSRSSQPLGPPSRDASPPPPGAAAQVQTAQFGQSYQEGWAFERVLAMTRGGEPAGSPELLASGVPLRPETPDQHDEQSALFRMPAQSAADLGQSHWPRQFALVALADVVHLVTIPVPWADARVEVLVNTRQGPTGSAVSVAVRDPAVGAGLAYMSRGAFATAARLFTNLEAMLYDKVVNPLGAAAGAYVLVGSATTDEPRGWDPWLTNLRDWFDWLSDGAILWAMRKLRGARDEADLELARTGLIAAYDRGVPYYTLGLSWLMDGLADFPDDPQCAQRLGVVRQLSRSVDLREPFVIVRLPARRH